MRILLIGASGIIGRAVSDLLSPTHEVVQASRAGTVRVDIADPESIRSMYRRVGTVDAVICCAGTAVRKPLLVLSDADIQASLANKLTGQVNVVRLGVDHVSDGGVFILTSGVFSQRPTPGVPALALVNGALESFTRAAALDLPRGVRLNIVSPPFIKESAAKMGLSMGLPTAENAKAYRELLEGTQTGAVLFPA